MTNHPNDQTLAAFIDGQLDDRARRAVVEHLAECEECRDIVMMADEVAIAEFKKPVDPDNVVRPRFGKGWIVPLAAAASLIVVLLVSRDQLTNQLTGGMSDVQADYGLFEERDVKPRLSGFQYKPLKRRMRGGNEDDHVVQMLQARRNELMSKKGTPSWKEYRAIGAASILTGKWDEAVAAMERAAELAPREPVVINDLAAAYIEQVRSAKGDPTRAIATAERAWQIAQTPEAAWNRAVAYELVEGRGADAIRAWQEYLRLDDTSAWAAEARRNLQALQPTP